MNGATVRGRHPTGEDTRGRHHAEAGSGHHSSGRGRGGVTVGLPAGPASAIIGGQVDGTRHPYVGTLDASAMGRPDGPTGVLISPTVLLTAGHVTRDRAQRGLQARVRFEPVRAAATTWYTGTVHTNPSFDPQRADDPGDLGVVLYGVSEFVGGSNGGGTPHPDRASAGTRKVAQQTFNSLTRAWLRLQQHVDGQVCFGDSGSPSLFAGSDVIAGILVGGLGPCRNTAWDQRIDTPAARAFLGHYMTLP